MSEPVFLDTTVVLATSINGTADWLGRKLKHESCEESESIFSFLKKKIEDGSPLGRISTVAERECRNTLEKAIWDTIDENWPKNKPKSKEDRLKWAASFDQFKRTCRLQLEDNLSVLAREPISQAEKQKYLKKINLFFAELESKYRQQREQNEYEMFATSPRFRSLKHKVRTDCGDWIDNHAYKPGIEPSDKEILAEIAAFSKNKGATLYALDNHFISKWAQAKIKDELNIFCASPSEFREDKHK